MSKTMEKAEIITSPPRIHYIPNFVTEKEEELLLSKIYSSPKPKWVQLSNRRLQNWGGLPLPKGMLVETIPSWLQSVMTKIDDLQIFDGKKSNHVLINEYLSGQGIMPHVDGPLFYPTISTVSLGSHTVLDFYHPLNTSFDEDQQSSTVPREQFSERSLGSIFLERRSLIVVKEDMYNKYLHGIKERSEDSVSADILNLKEIQQHIGDTVQRKTRISLTIRHCPKVLKNMLWGGRKNGLRHS